MQWPIVIARAIKERCSEGPGKVLFQLGLINPIFGCAKTASAVEGQLYQSSLLCSALQFCSSNVEVEGVGPAAFWPTSDLLSMQKHQVDSHLKQRVCIQLLKPHMFFERLL